MILRKLAHMAEYAILFLLSWRGLGESDHLSRKRKLFVALVLTVFYAATDEYHQTFVPGRSGAVRDVAIDVLGAVGGLILAVKLKDLK